MRTGKETAPRFSRYRFRRKAITPPAEAAGDCSGRSAAVSVGGASALASRDQEQRPGLTTYQLFAPITVGVD
jgi:hypothetical protein